MVRAVVFGVTGYTGIELIRILSSHPEVVITGGSSRQWAGKTASEVFPYIRPERDFPILEAGELQKRQDADAAFLALPHGESAALIRPLMESGFKIIDLSADCRLHDAEVYAQWYGPHRDPDILERAVYGLPELHREALKQTRLVANPGCYPTTVILGLAPLASVGEVDITAPIVDSKSGISGAGRGAKLNTSFCESGEGFKPYGVIGHRHIPEMEQELTQLSGTPVTVRFTPHLIPVSRGMVSTIYVPMKGKIAAQTIRDAYTEYYSDEPFVRVLPGGTFPDTIHVRGSNVCMISVEVDERTGIVVVMSALDNLVKGASGAAVQNMNLVMGLDEGLGLLNLPMYP